VIVVDSSAVIAILEDEAEAAALSARLALDPERALSAASYVEMGTVLAGRRRSEPDKAQQFLDAFLEEAGIGLAPVDATQARLALEARVRYGRGFSSVARLNFGDCFAYALAKSLDAPLLYVGDDFTGTDIRSALEST
jgi:ribonuclease VapC